MEKQILKVGITGQAGFIGTHLYNYLKFICKDIDLIPFSDEYFKSEELLTNFVKRCDTIIHLAAMNRHGDPQVIYNTNIDLVAKLIEVFEKNDVKPYIIFSSSTQEDLDNPYGRSKKVGRQLLGEWANRSGAKFTALIIPNVYGPFGVPFYNSVVSTFAYQLTNKLQPKIEVDSVMNVIYINDLVEVFKKVMNDDNGRVKTLKVEHTDEIKVSELLNLLHNYKNKYFDNYTIPKLNSKFEISLFNTFRSYIDPSHFPVLLEMRTDSRGYLVEAIKSHNEGQTFYSVTKQGITRGNHFHTRKIERFCVIKGEAIIRLRKIGTDKVIEYKVSGDKPSFVDIPIFYTHNITNIGKYDLETLFWSNEMFNPNDTDTYFEEV